MVENDHIMPIYILCVYQKYFLNAYCILDLEVELTMKYPFTTNPLSRL